MSVTFADFEQSIRRAPKRARVLIMAASMSVTYRGPLAQAAGVSYAQLMGILHGDPPKYSERRALVPLGLIREVRGANGLVLEITERGRRKARQLTARTVREEARRRAARKVAEHLPAARAEGERPPSSTATCTWSFTFAP